MTRLIPALILLALASALMAAPAVTAAPAMTIPRVAQAPSMHQSLDEASWAASAASTGFSLLMKGDPAAPSQPLFVACYDDAALYIGARLPLPHGVKPVSNNNTHDAPVWEDDAVEVFVDVENQGAVYYQFILNPGGGYWESMKQDKAWSREWQHIARTYSDRWEAFFAIPWKSLGLAKAPAEGSQIGFNVCWDCKTGGSFAATWSPLGEGSFHQPTKFGKLRLGGIRPFARLTRADVSDGALELEGLTYPSGRIYANVRNDAGWTGKTDEIDSDIIGMDDPQQLWGVASQHTSLALPRDGRFAKGGLYSAEIHAETLDGTPLLAQGISFTVPKPLEVTVKQLALSGLAIVDVNAAGALTAGVRPSVEATVTDSRGGQVAKQSIALDAAGAGTTRFDLSGSPAGEYEVTIVAKDPQGQEIISRIEKITRPEKPWWLGSKEGITDKVFPPFQPLKVSEGKVLPWGRTYEFASGVFPSKVVSKQAALLAGPVRLRATVNGEEQRWDGKPAQITKATQAVVDLTGAAKSQALSVRGKVAVEFDGMIRVDFRVDGKPGTKVDDLTLEMPIPAQYAKYLYQFGGPWSGATSAGALPKLPWTAPFRAFLWLGDEDRGLCWFSESDRNIYVKDETKVCEIAQEGANTVLRVHLLEGYELKEPLDYTFGFEATPIRPNPQDVWDFKISHAGNYGLETPQTTHMSTVTYPLAGNVDVSQGTVEMWVRPGFDTDPPVKSDDPARGNYNQELFNVIFDNGAQMGYYWNVDDRGMRIYTRQGTTYPIVIGAKNRWKQGEWHHIAVTWSDKIRLYQDGQQLTTSGDFSGLGIGGKGGKIRIGGGQFDVEAVRVSSLPRTAFEVDKPLEVDGDTLLLDSLDSGYAKDGKRQAQTKPAKMTADGSVTGGAFEGGPVACDGKFGKAARFYVTDKPRSRLDDQADLGVKTICFHEHWTDIQNYPSTTHVKELHSLTDACHKKGIKLLLYHGYEMSDIAPEFPLYSEECLVSPRAGGYTRQPAQTDYIVCYRSKWQDFMAAGLGKLMDEYGIDGVYLDGTANPWACSNELHGCGYRRPDGSLRAVYPIFDTRDMMKRIFNLVKSRKPDGEINVHQSTCMTIPTIGFATSYWDGEQFGSIDRGPRFDQVLPLTAFRCEFMGHQWGVPAEFLCYDRPYTIQEAYGFTLLHDVLVRGGLEGIETHLWKAMDSFGKKSAQWLPYWRNSEYVTVPGEQEYASVYLHKGKDLMMVVSNLSAEARPTTVTLNLAKMGLEGRRLQATDVVAGEQIGVDGGKIALNLKSMEWRMLWVK